MGQKIIIPLADIYVDSNIRDELLRYLVDIRVFEIVMDNKESGYFVTRDPVSGCSVSFIPFTDKPDIGNVMVACSIVPLAGPPPDVQSLVWWVIDPFREYVKDVVIRFKFADREELEEKSRRIVRGEW